MPIDEKKLIELRDELWRAMVRDTDTPTDPLTIWQPLYADLLAAVLTRGTPEDWMRLTALLRESHPLHPMMLPALADALEARGRPKRDGRRRKLSPIEEQQAARDVLYLRRTGHSNEQAIAEVAGRLRVSESVVERAFTANVPSYRRPQLKTARRL